MNNLKPAGLDPGHTLALAVLGSVLRTREAGGGWGVVREGVWGVGGVQEGVGVGLDRQRPESRPENRLSRPPVPSNLPTRILIKIETKLLKIPVLIVMASVV